MYTVSSLMNAIEKSRFLFFDSAEAACPRKDSTECKIRYQKCGLGHEHKCQQTVSVFDTRKCLRHIHVYFTLGGQNYDGYINENDAQLHSLIQKGYLDTSMLISVDNFY